MIAVHWLGKGLSRELLALRGELSQFGTWDLHCTLANVNGPILQIGVRRLLARCFHGNLDCYLMVGMAGSLLSSEGGWYGLSGYSGEL